MKSDAHSDRLLTFLLILYGVFVPLNKLIPFPPFENTLQVSEIVLGLLCAVLFFRGLEVIRLPLSYLEKVVLIAIGLLSFGLFFG